MKSGQNSDSPRPTRPSIVHSRPALLALEPRYMFDGAGAGEVAEKITDLPRLDGGLLRFGSELPAVPAATVDAHAQAERLVNDFLQRPDALAQLFTTFNGGQSAPSADWQSAAQALIASARAGELGVRVELRSHTELWGGLGAFAAHGPDGQPVIYLNADWINSGTATPYAVSRILVEELGHFIDFKLNAGNDTAGDEGEAFASRLFGWTTNSADTSRISGDDDRFTLTIDGQRVEVEMVALLFSVQSFFAGTSATNLTADLEQNALVLGAALPGTRFLFVSDPASAFIYSGNNVRGTLYGIDASNNIVCSYFGEISRLVKTGSNVQACQFYVYPDPLSATDATKITTGTPAQTILININGSFATGQSVRTSSDPVSAALNNLIAPNAAPTANADTVTATEAGGVLNGTAGTDATGSVVTNDTDANTYYAIDTANNRVLVSSDALTVTRLSNASTGNSATPTAGTTSANGSVVAGVYGSLTMGADGTYRYVVNNSLAAVQALRGTSNTLTEIFAYSISDGKGGVSSSTLTVTIRGANDTPVAADDYNVAKESIAGSVGFTGVTAYSTTPGSTYDRIGTKATGNVLTNDSDVDRYGETKQVAGIIATATGSSPGRTTLTFSTLPSNVSVGYYVFLDGDNTNNNNNPGTALRDASNNPITIFSIDNATKTFVLSGVVANATLSANQILGFANSLAGAAYKDASISAPGSTGSVNVTLSGTVGPITAGMTVTGSGVPSGTTVASVTYDAVTGLATAVTLNQEITASSTALTFTSAAGATLTGAHGTLVLNSDGSYVYTPTVNNPNLSSGATATEEFSYTIVDAAGATSSAKLYITVLGSGSTDPDAVADTVTASEAGGVNNGTAGTNPTGTAGTSLLANDTTPDGGTLAIVGARSNQVSTNTTVPASTGGVTDVGFTSYHAKVVGLYGTLYLKSDGSYAYVVDNANATVQSLRTSGESLSETFLYTIQNSIAAKQDVATLTIAITGANDAPVAVADTDRAIASGGAAAGSDPAGNVLLNETDVDAGDSHTVTAVSAGNTTPTTTVAASSTSTTGYTSIAGSYGTLRIGADGTYVYLLNSSHPSVLALSQGQTLPTPEVFTYEVTDAAGLKSTTTLTISIEGNNSPPTNAAPTSVAFQQNTTYSFTGGNAVSVSEPDNNLDAVTLTVAHGTLDVSEVGSSYDATTGVLTLAGGAQIYYAPGTSAPFAYTSPNGTAALTLYGTRDQINAALASLRYTPTTDYAGTDTLTISSIDSGGLKDVDTVTLNTLALAVTASGPVNEGSTFAMFQVTGTVGETVSLSLGNTSTLSDNDATISGFTTIEYSVNGGATWITYVPGSAQPTIPASGKVDVRVTITSEADSSYEGAETFTLNASIATGSGATASAIATIVDDGTGTKYPGTLNLDGTPTPSTTGLDDDRLLSVTSPTVNEASPYAIFTVDGALGQLVSLALTDGSAGSPDYGSTLEYSVDGGLTWTAYTSGTIALNGTNGTALVRTPVKQDSFYEGPETFTLTATPTGSSAASGTATIKDDGTGEIFNANGTLDTTTPKDDDRVVTVTSPTVNEASPYAVFTVDGALSQLVSLSLTNGSAGSTDYGSTLEYSVDGGLTWTTYTSGTIALTGTNGTALVRTPVKQDATYEGPETFTLTATPTGGSAAIGTATIKDDGTGDIFNANGTLDTTTPKDDDRAVTVTSPTVNEASPYAVFTVDGALSQLVSLSLTNGSAGSADYGSTLEYSVDGGLTWTTYTSGTIALTGTNGTALVRTPVKQDATYEGPETFTLTATPTGGSAAIGTATIKDDGTGDIFNANGTLDTTTPKDDDRAVTVTSPTVNEASPYAVFTVDGAQGQLVSLTLTNGSAGSADYGSTLEYSVDGGLTWTAYTSGTIALTGTNGTALVRTPVKQDATYEGPETFTLTATPTGGSAAIGTATIKDDGTGDIFNPNGTLDTTTPKDDDRAVTVTSPTVNEASPYAVFTVDGAQGQLVSLTLTNGSAGSADYGSTLEYSVDGGLTWTAYTSGTIALTGTNGTALVRTPVKQDATYEGPETFTLTATPTGGTAAIGTATITDDGTGDIFNPNGTLDTTTPKDDDRALTVTSPTVNEASPYAVFTVDGALGQLVSLALTNGSAGSADYGSALEYSVDGGLTWTAYTSGTIALTGTNGTALVRTPVKQDATYEGPETFTLTATPTGGTAAIGTATIRDDGTGDIFNPNGTLDTTTPKDDDRALTVTSPTVNEASPYAVFTVDGAQGQLVSLSLTNGSAGSADYGSTLEYSVDGGLTWTTYTSGTIALTGTNGTALVRTPVKQDATYEGPETFTLTATPTGGTAVAGTATIKDDGTGDIFNPNGTLDTTTPKDDDRALTVTSPTVNEASPYAVFTVDGAQGQIVSLALTNGSAGSADYGSTLEYSVDGGLTWTTYTSGTIALTGTNGTALVRTPVKQDATYEGPETFTLTATPTGGTAAIGTATIKDDGTGDIFNPNGTLDTTTPKDDDRALTVTSPTVNEASPYAVFTVDGAQGQLVSLSLTNGSAGSADYGSTLEYSVDGGLTWTNYTSGTIALTGTNGTALVRTPVKQDATYEGPETFTLTTTPTGGTAAIGTATITDDGTGDIFNANGTLDTTTPKDDDRALTVTSPTVNEASPYAVFTVDGALGQFVSLALTNGSAGSADYGSTLEYSVDGGLTWTTYTSGTIALTGTNGTALVRTPVKQDTVYEGSETFTLTATPTGGTAAIGTATITDDGTGDIFNANGTLNTTTPKDDDRAVTVTSPTVNEASPYTVFIVDGAQGQLVSLSLTNGSAGSADYGSTLEYSVDGGLTWTTYTSGAIALTGTNGTALVRTPVKQDAVYEGSETFTLTATPTGGTAVVGTATIKDDGTGDIFNANGTLNTTTPKDDDRTLTISSPTVNEASTYAVFTITGNAGRIVSLATVEGTGKGFADLDQTLPLQVWNGTAWVNYSTSVAIPASGTLLVRVNIAAEQDTINETAETFQLRVTPATGTAVTGTATIVDEANGVIFTGVVTNNVPETSTTGLDDDRDIDGIPLVTEDTLARLAGGNTDLNGDGKVDSEQNALATLAWVLKADFDTAINPATVGTTRPTSIITLGVATGSGANTVDASAQLLDVAVLDPNTAAYPAGTRTYAGGKPTNPLITSPWDPLQFTVRPASGFTTVADANTSRAGLQVLIRIDISRANLPESYFNAYLKYVSAEAISAAGSTPLRDFSGAPITQAGWYDFTQRKDAAGNYVGDGARFVTANGKIVAIEVTITDNAFGDSNPAVGLITDPGMPVHIRAVPPALADGSPLEDWTRPGRAQFDQSEITRTPLRFDSALLGVHGAKALDGITGLEALFANASRPTASADARTALWQATRFPGDQPAISVLRGLPDQLLAPATPTHFSVPTDAFAVTGLPTARLSATLADGQPLPGWLQFDARTGTFAATAPADLRRELAVRVHAAVGSLATSTTFRVHVGDERSATAQRSFTEQIRHTARARAVAALR